MADQDVQEFNRVYVLDSLPKEDTPTGKSLFNDTLRWSDAFHDNLSAVYLAVPDSSSMNSALRRILSEVEAGTGPIVHLEAHGNMDGIRLANGAAFRWENFLQFLVPINAACKNNLLLTLAVCKGLWLSKILKSTMFDRAPFWALVGAEDNIKVSEVESFELVYRELYRTLDGDQALEAINSQHSRAPYRFWHCEYLFTRAWLGYLKTQCMGKGQHVRINELIRKAKKLPAFTSRTERQWRAHFRIETDYRNQEASFDKSLESYFMIDLYPENRSRVSVQFNHLVELVEGPSGA